MHGKYCNSCDYKRNKKWFDKRHQKRKEKGYYIGKKQYKYYTKAKEHYGEICADCGWNKYPEVLQVHHIDENRKNNSIENLVVLCPTCHNTRHFLNNTGLFTPKRKDGDNQQPSENSNILEGSTTNSRVQTDNAEDSNADTSALPGINGTSFQITLDRSNFNFSDDIV